MSKPKVIVTRRWPEQVEAEMQRLFDVELNTDDRPMTEDEIRNAMMRADALCPTVSDKLGPAIFAGEGIRTKILGNFGVGFNHIDIEAAKAAGVRVTNTPGVLTDATADIALTLILMVARRAGEGEREVRDNAWTGWRPTHLLGTQVTGKTLGIIGMGRIAKAVAHRAHHGFDMDVVFYNRSMVDEAEARSLGARQVDSIDEVLETADFVSLHCPGGAETFHLMNAERIGRMKPSAYLINTARGDVVDEQALATALNDGTIAGAGLDVYQGEPDIAPALLSARNTVLLPHLGSATTETRTAMGMKVVENLKAFFAGETPPDVVV